MGCRSPDCDEVAIDGDRFCVRHREMFTRVKRELDEEIARQRKGKTMTRRCRALGCDETRRNGSPYCVMHVEMETAD